MPLPSLDPVPSDDRLPASAEVVIVGGGIIGASAALFAGRARHVGRACARRAQIAAEQSGRNWGWVPQDGPRPARDPADASRACGCGRGMNETVGAETGFRRTGILYSRETEAELARRDAWLEHARPYQLDTRLLGPAELAELLPGCRAGPRPAALHRERRPGRAAEGGARPSPARRARAGAAILTELRRARDRDPGRARVAAAVTEKGRIACESVRARRRRLVAPVLRQSRHRPAAAQGPRLGDAHGAARRAGPRARARGRLRASASASTAATRSRTRPQHALDRARQLPPLPAVPAGAGSSSARLHSRLGRPLRRGVAHAAALGARRSPRPSSGCRVLDPEPASPILDDAPERTSARACSRLSRRQRSRERWAGHDRRDAGCRAGDLRGRRASPGFFIATGFSGHGFGIGPARGRLMADLVDRRDPIVDPAPFRWSRF